MVILLENVAQVPDLRSEPVISRDSVAFTRALMLLSREEVMMQFSLLEVRGITSRIRWKWAEITLTRLSDSSAQM